jgi:succinate dehydrogenase / fumarate reductase cytochrome b subunit
MQTMERADPGGEPQRGSDTHVAPVHEPRRPAPWPVAFYRSAVGKKWVMAITGIILMGYVLAHMIGNLKIYFGAHDLRLYAEYLRELLYPLVPRTITLWSFRVVLILAFAFHIHAAWALSRMNRRSRAGGYVSSRDYQAASVASRSMRWTGVIILLFVLFHLADLTWGFLNPDFVRGDVYRNVQASLGNAVPAAIYIVANIALGIHLWHGAWSMFQTMGLNNPRYNAFRKAFAIGFAAVVTIGNLSFPILVVSGVAEDEVCFEQDDRIVTCEEVFADALRTGRVSVEQFEQLSDTERTQIIEAFELNEELRGGE